MDFKIPRHPIPMNYLGSYIISSNCANVTPFHIFGRGHVVHMWVCAKRTFLLASQPTSKEHSKNHLLFKGILHIHFFQSWHPQSCAWKIHATLNQPPSLFGGLEPGGLVGFWRGFLPIPYKSQGCKKSKPPIPAN